MKRLLIIAAVVIIISNAAVLARVHYNRSGEPQAITLSERELTLPYSYRRYRDENSGLSLKLKWRTTAFDDLDYYWHSFRDFTVSEQRLQELGFDLPDSCVGDGVTRGGGDKSRPAWLALEYDGPAYARWLQQAEKYVQQRTREIGKVDAETEKKTLERLNQNLKSIRHYESRLLVIDIALDKDDLLERYGDQSQVLIFAGKIANTSYCNAGFRRIRVSVEQVLTSYIYVPLRMHEIFEQFPGRREREAAEGPRYKVEIAIGKLAEPWLVGVSTMDGQRY